MSGRKRVLLLIVVTGMACFLMLCLPSCVSAEEALPVTGDGAYPVEHYYLDFYADVGSAWLPWNWGDNIGAQLLSVVHMLTNVIWRLCVVLSSFGVWLIGMAYQVDFISSAIELLASNIQKIAGIGPGGFMSHGLFPSLALLAILCAGVFFAWTGLVKNQVSRAVSDLLSFIVIFVLGMGVIAYAEDYLVMINDFQKDFNQEVLDIGAMLMYGGDGGRGTEGIEDNLFSVLVGTPYLFLQYGTTDAEVIGQERIGRLLSLPPLTEEREAVVKDEVVELENENMGMSSVISRFAMVLLIFVCDIVIDGCVMLFCGMLIVSEILFILYVSFFPVALAYSLFPDSTGRLRQSLTDCFGMLMMRPCMTLILTVVFGLSKLCYELSRTENFLWMMFLQVILFVFSFVNSRKLLGYMRIGSGASDMARSSGRLGQWVMNALLFKSLMRKSEKAGAAGSGSGQPAPSGNGGPSGPVYPGNYPPSGSGPPLQTLPGGGNSGGSPSGGGHPGSPGGQNGGPQMQVPSYGGGSGNGSASSAAPAASSGNHAGSVPLPGSSSMGGAVASGPALSGNDDNVVADASWREVTEDVSEGDVPPDVVQRPKYDRKRYPDIGPARLPEGLAGPVSGDIVDDVAGYRDMDDVEFSGTSQDEMTAMNTYYEDAYAGMGMDVHYDDEGRPTVDFGLDDDGL